MRLDRIDRVGLIEIGDAPSLPTPGHAPAQRHPGTGYLSVDALLARDGLLTYSDGATSWVEHRSRAALEAACESFANAPVTDQHPQRMVDATSWSQVARGVTLGTPTIEVHDGVAYLRARLLITDSALIRKIEQGQRELSIGFTSEIVPVPKGANVGYDADQTAIVGNHNASVPRGRAGPACRVLLDSHDHPVPWSDPTMAIKNTPAPKTDNMGPPVDMVEVPGPDGTPVSVPTWIAAALAELEQMKAAAVTGGDTPAVAPAAAVQPIAPAVAAQVAPAAVPQQQAKPLDALDQRRRKLDRLSIAAGVDDASFDSGDAAVLARAYLAKRMPTIKTDSYDRAQLAALVDVAADLPVVKTDAREPAAPWGGNTRPPQREAKTDANDDAEAAFLKSQGYEA